MCGSKILLSQAFGHDSRPSDWYLTDGEVVLEGFRWTPAFSAAQHAHFFAHVREQASASASVNVGAPITALKPRERCRPGQLAASTWRVPVSLMEPLRERKFTASRRSGRSRNIAPGPWTPLSGARSLLPLPSTEQDKAVAKVADRITVNAAQCGGRPCVRGMRIRVVDVLELLASGLTQQQVLEELPDLESEDVAACLRFASGRLDHPILAA